MTTSYLLSVKQADLAPSSPHQVLDDSPPPGTRAAELLRPPPARPMIAAVPDSKAEAVAAINAFFCLDLDERQLAQAVKDDTMAWLGDAVLGLAVRQRLLTEQLQRQRCHSTQVAGAVASSSGEDDRKDHLVRRPSPGTASVPASGKARYGVAKGELRRAENTYVDNARLVLVCNRLGISRHLLQPLSSGGISRPSDGRAGCAVEALLAVLHGRDAGRAVEVVHHMMDFLAQQ